MQLQTPWITNEIVRFIFLGREVFRAPRRSVVAVAMINNDR